MTKQLIHAGVLFVDVLAHSTMIVEGPAAISPWVLGTCGISLVAFGRSAVRAVHSMLAFDGPAQLT